MEHSLWWFPKVTWHAELVGAGWQIPPIPPSSTVWRSLTNPHHLHWIYIIYSSTQSRNVNTLIKNKWAANTTATKESWYTNGSTCTNDHQLMHSGQVFEVKQRMLILLNLLFEFDPMLKIPIHQPPMPLLLYRNEKHIMLFAWASIQQISANTWKTQSHLLHLFFSARWCPAAGLHPYLIINS